ncbi:MAG: RNase adapter RapZ [Thermoanaerobaculia bacterium]
MSGGLESFVIVTGLSGSGKSYVERCFEDLGFFCIDNLPLSLLDSLLDELLAGDAPKQKVCVVLDIRNPGFASQFPAALGRIKERVTGARLIFLDASEESLVRRFSESRRPHPISEGASLLEALRREREMLSDVRSLADLVIDTTSLTVHELRGLISRAFGSGERGLVVSVTSFGFKHGSPHDVDLLFDVRFLANPHFVAELKDKTGEDPDVAAYIEKDPETGPFVERLLDFVGYLLPRYEKENKSYLSIGIGCTGGRHRSVYVAERLAGELRRRKFPVRIRHRDASRG